MAVHHSKSIIRRLMDERDRLRARADEIDRAIDTMQSVLVERAHRNGNAAPLAAAIALRNGHGAAKKRQTKAANAAAFSRFAALLSEFGDTPRTLVAVRDALGFKGQHLNGVIANAVRHKWLKKRDGGYVRTAKPFEPERSE